MTTNPLRTLREARHLTQAELARRAGYSGKNALGHLERSTPPSWYRLARMADVLGCTTDAILGRVKPEAVISELTRQDRELLDAMQRDAEQLIGPQVMRLAKVDWRSLARSAFLGTLFRMRDHGMRALPKPPKDWPTPPEDWFRGWEGDRQKAARAIEDSAHRGGKIRRRLTQGAK